MKTKLLMKNLLLPIFLLCTLGAFSQDAIKNVLVETYYVSDSKDATDTTGGFLEPGSKTYRIFLQLKPGCKLISLYGDKSHTLKISSTADIFNNSYSGETFGKNIRLNSLRKNTVALDSWLTIGQVTSKSANTYFGIPKSDDTDGSIIGGVNNDGGSKAVPGGLLTNSDPSAGPALTVSDGMDTLASFPTNWVTKGFLDPISGEDSTIFGSIKRGKEFVSNNASIASSGITGVDPDKNQILIAQITTKGEISFEINAQVYDPSVKNGYSSFYVADGNDTVLNNEKKIINVSPYLKYPPTCGCTDKNYMEFSKKYLCSSNEACKTRIVLGCMDPTACNYNPDANYNVQYLCCYPGLCYDRDLSNACPQDGETVLQLDIYPNPATNAVTIRSSEVRSKDSRYVIYNYYGRAIFEKELGVIDGKILDNLNVDNYEPGIYLVRLFAGSASDSRMFIKK